MTKTKKSGNQERLSADRPLADPTDDRLGYAPFAQHLADSICAMSPANGLVMAVYGPWGSGKTTLLNFVLYYLQHRPKDEQPVIVRFNPWWFSGQEGLTRQFFGHIQAAIARSKLSVHGLADKVADFAEAVSEVPIPYASLGKATAKLVRPVQKDVTALKETIADALHKRGRTILVIIDDIDRLTPDEMKQVFRLVKAVGDFPNVVYLLAFDKDAAVKAMEKTLDTLGSSYLEKIIQVPFELVLPDRSALREMLFEKLTDIIGDTPSGLFDPMHWMNVYHDGIDGFISTPRHVMHLTNSIAVTYPSVRNEVNPVDFIAIEALRVFVPELYKQIRSNADNFAGIVGSEWGGRERQDGRRPFYDACLNLVADEQRDGVKALLLRLFPKLAAIWQNTFYTAESAPEWRKRLRICSPDIFPVYFRLSLPSGSISNADMAAVLATVGDGQAFGAQLVALAGQTRPDGTTRVRAVLERLEDYTRNDIPAESIPPMVHTFLEVGDQLLRVDDAPGIFEFGNDIRIGRVIRQLLRRLEEPERYQHLAEAMRTGRALATITHEMAVFNQEYELRNGNPLVPESERLLTAEHVNALQEIACERVRVAARDGTLREAPQFVFILYRWREWSTSDEVVRWVQDLVSDETGLLLLLEQCVQRSAQWLTSDRAARMAYRIQPQVLEPFLQLSWVLERVRQLAAQPNADEATRGVAKLFIEACESQHA